MVASQNLIQQTIKHFEIHYQLQLGENDAQEIIDNVADLMKLLVELRENRNIERQEASKDNDKFSRTNKKKGKWQ
ncbi:MAG: hypothetical protein PHC34_04715 [Candidatus Gastranaerophilales bacterium]|nr:hypothetical protein [Candidatus Gastranaerophilales bacterium]